MRRQNISLISTSIEVLLCEAIIDNTDQRPLEVNHTLDNQDNIINRGLINQECNRGIDIQVQEYQLEMTLQNSNT